MLSYRKRLQLLGDFLSPTHIGVLSLDPTWGGDFRPHIPLLHAPNLKSWISPCLNFTAGMQLRRAHRGTHCSQLDCCCRREADIGHAATWKPACGTLNPLKEMFIIQLTGRYDSLFTCLCLCQLSWKSVNGNVTKTKCSFCLTKQNACFQTL